MKIKPIRTKAQHAAALKRIDKLMSNKGDKGDELEVLAILVEHYEQKIMPNSHICPVAAIRFRMEQQGLIQNDLVPYIGSKSKVSEILSGTRELSKNMIRQLHHGLAIPLESLFK